MVDVRAPGERQQKRIAGSVGIPLTSSRRTVVGVAGRSSAPRLLCGRLSLVDCREPAAASRIHAGQRNRRRHCRMGRGKLPLETVRIRASLEESTMSLFIVRHQHAADGCPAQDPFMGASLLNHLSRPNVRKFGLQIQGEAVVQGEHTMYLIVDAVDEGRLREFMQPFQMAGSLDIYPASTCVRTVASGGCAAPLPAAADVPTLDPEEACQQAIDAGMVVHRAHPLNCETSHRGARWRRRHAERALLHAQQLRHAQSRRRGASGSRLAASSSGRRASRFAISRTCDRKHRSSRWSVPATDGRCSIGPPRARSGGWAPSARRSGPECRSSRSWTAPACARTRRRCCFAAPTAGPWTAGRNRCASSAVFASTTRATAMCCWPTR